MDPIEKPSKSLIQTSLRYAALRMHSKQEMISYLQEKTSNLELINQVIEYFESNNLINDQEFSRLWTESRLRKGKGDLIIQSELYQKGITKQMATEAINAIPPHVWLDAVSTVALKYQSKWLPLSGYSQKAKLFQLLRQRGFSTRHIDAFIRSKVE